MDSLSGDWFDCSAHMLWVGERTRQLDGAHVEFLSGVGNPLGVKIGPDATPDEVGGAVRPARTRHACPGRLTLITRFGADKVDEHLPRAPRAPSRRAGHPVVWACDPMHGNTFTSEGGRKTRRFNDILSELRAFFAVHREPAPGRVGSTSSSPATTSPNAWVGRRRSSRATSGPRYTTTCDPRLNARQSLDLAFRVAEFLRV